MRPNRNFRVEEVAALIMIQVVQNAIGDDNDTREAEDFETRVPQE